MAAFSSGQRDCNEGILQLMRSHLLGVLVAVVLASASGAALAQGGNEEEPEEDAAPELIREREPFLTRDGQVADNEQLGGEPSLTEAERPSGDAIAQTGAKEGCDLDCIEAGLAEEEQREQRRKRTLEVRRETGAIGTEEETDAGDALAAEPSTTTVAEAAPEATARQLPTRLGPVRIPVGKADDWIGIGLAVQMEFTYDQQLATGDFPRTSIETLEFRRIRLTLSGSFIDGRIQSRLQINMTPSAFELIDMWFAFTRFKFATLRIGQFKIPYDRYRAQSFAALSFVDWAATTRMFGSERQIGAEMLARGGFLGLEYSAGIFTGVNARASHAVGITEVYGNRPQSPSDFGAGEVVSEFHPAIVGRVAKNFGEIDTASNSDVLRTPQLRHSVGAGIAWDARPVPTENLGLRLSAEWLGKIRGFYVDVISYVAWYAPWEGGKMLLGPLGFMGESGYRFTPIWELAMRYNIVYLTPWLRSDARAYGQAQIMNAPDRAQAIAQYGRNGDQTTSQDLTIAGSARMIGNSLKVTTETAWVMQLWNTGRLNGIAVNAQIQLVF